MKLKIFILVLFLLPFVAISFFNQPFNDDYWSANAIRSFGRLGQIKYCFENVSARYFASFLMGLFNTLPQEKTWIFKIWPIFTLLLLFISFAFFYISIIPKNKKEAIFFSLVFVALHIIAMRSLFEGLYWMSSAISYQVAIMFFLITAGCIIRFYRAQKKVHLIIAVLCCTLLPGSVESMVPLFFIFLLLVFFIVYKNNLPVKPVIYCLIANLLAITVVFSAHGNYARIAQSKTGYTSNIFSAIFYSFRSAGYYSFIWIITPAIILSLLILIPLLKKITDDNYEKLSAYSKNLYWIILLLIFFGCITIYFPEHYFESQIPYPRITTLYFFSFYHFLTLLISFILLRFKNNKQLKFFCTYLINYRLFFAMIFFVALFCSSNFLHVSKDLVNGTAYYYNIEANQRFDSLKNCKSDTCYVQPHKYWASSIENFQKEELNTNPFIHIDKYFGKTILYER